MSFGATTPDCSGESRATQPEQEQNRQRCIEWDYERLKMKQDDIFDTISNRYNTAWVLIDTPSVFEEEAALLSFQCKNKAEYFEKLEKLRVQKYETLKEKLQDLVYSVLLDDDAAGGSRKHDLIELNRSPNLVLGLRLLLGDTPCQSDGAEAEIDSTYEAGSSRSPSCRTEDGQAYAQNPVVPLESEDPLTVSIMNSPFRFAILEEQDAAGATSRSRTVSRDDAEVDQCWVANNEEAGSRNYEQATEYDALGKDHAIHEDEHEVHRQHPTRHQRTPSSASSTASSISSISTTCSCCEGGWPTIHGSDDKTTAANLVEIMHKRTDASRTNMARSDTNSTLVATLKHEFFCQRKGELLYEHGCVSERNITRQPSLDMDPVALYPNIDWLRGRGSNYGRRSPQNLQAPGMNSPIRVVKLEECTATETKRRKRRMSFNDIQARSDRKKMKMVIDRHADDESQCDCHTDVPKRSSWSGK
ncbi:hypothetical protein HJFPF1_13581 [Paramyrothecium foliicola]|nr:hypothetical protein HJFPF1_13581 [Paramyrothecium foliicola]